ncbi:MAG: 50S ribosomal protein L24 [Candidatus Aenigmarchaeota archaeon]|jgi:large subunit ribosomal protein L24|nr:50S ribosomal protein L24 [Candidatus Aenigmarchaeota archaeon]
MKRPKSKKPRKQRKFLYNAPLHIRRKMISAHLSKELRKKYKRRSIPLRKGDEVKVMRGEFKGTIGKIVRIDTKEYKVYIDTVKKKRSIGTEYLVPIHPSNLLITNLNLEDKYRIKMLERGKNVSS